MSSSGGSAEPWRLDDAGTSRLYGVGGPCVILPDTGMDADIWHGAERLKQGPASLREARRLFPEAFLAQLRQEHLADYQRLQANVAGGIIYRSDFSGLDMFLFTGFMLEVALQQNVSALPMPDFVGFLAVHATDPYPPARQVLQAYPDKFCPQHLFSDVCGAWPRQVLDALSAAEKTSKVRLAALPSGIDQAERKQRITALGQQCVHSMASILARSLTEPPVRNHCFRHGACCTVGAMEGQAKDRDHLTMATAGLQCLEFAGYGNKNHLAGATTMSILCWLFQRIRMNEDIILIEEVESFKQYLPTLASYMSGYQYDAVVLSPHMFGFPATRHRVYAMFWKTCRVTVRESLGFALEPFRKSILLDGDALFCELEEELEDDIKPVAEVEGGRSKRRRRRILHRELSAGSLARLELHTRAEESRMGAQSGDHPRIVNLQQTPERATPTDLVPALQTKGRIYSFRKQRCLTANEHLGVMGIDIISPTPETDDTAPLFSGTSTMGPSSVLKCLAGLPENDKIHLAGNTMHQCCAGIFLARVLSITERRSAPAKRASTGEPQSGMGGLDLEDSD